MGSGLPGAKLDKVVGVVKAYSSCVGEGPFTCEWFGEEAEKLREAGGEYGAKTGRPRRVGPIDLVATRYGVQCQGATDIALTKLDVLSYMDEIPVCAHYELDGQQTDEFPFPAVLPDAKPVIEHHARLEVRHLRRPQVGGPAPGRPGLCGVCGAGHRLPHRLRVRGSRAGRHHPAVRLAPSLGTKPTPSEAPYGCLLLRLIERRSFPCQRPLRIPLASRYASEFMLHLFSADMRIETWRRLWVALARAEHKLGLPVTAEQVAELEAHITDIDYEAAAATGEGGPPRRHGPRLHLRPRLLPPPPASSTWAPPAAMSPTTPTWCSTGTA